MSCYLHSGGTGESHFLIAIVDKVQTRLAARIIAGVKVKQQDKHKMLVDYGAPAAGNIFKGDWEQSFSTITAELQNVTIYVPFSCSS